jgi:hypothetical protein
MHKAALFLKQLYRDVNKGYAEIRLIHKTGDMAQAKKIYRPANTIHTGDFDYLASINSDYHIYHRVNVSNTPDSKKPNISAIVALYVDIDDSSDEALDRLQNMHYPPTCVIYSGGGFHGYWLLREPLYVSSDKERANVERTMQGMILAYGAGADVKAKDITRILRTPFFYNIKDKYPEPLLCEIAYFDDAESDRYRFSSLHNHYAPLGTPERPTVRRYIPAMTTSTMPRRVKAYIENGASPGNRNHELYYVARWYNDVGHSQMDAEQDLIPRALADGLEQAEANTTIRSAFHAPRNAANSLPSHIRNLMAVEDGMDGE